MRHVTPMLSLQAVRGKDGIAAFLDRLADETDQKAPEVVAEPKFDGLSVEVVYEDGRFARGSTRGDGETGEDISHTMRTIRALPLRLARSDELEGQLAVRGEAILPKSSFQALNKARVERGQDPFANPRNARGRRAAPSGSRRGRAHAPCRHLLRCDRH